MAQFVWALALLCTPKLEPEFTWLFNSTINLISYELAFCFVYYSTALAVGPRRPQEALARGLHKVPSQAECDGFDAGERHKNLLSWWFQIRP